MTNAEIVARLTRLRPWLRDYAEDLQQDAALAELEGYDNVWNRVSNVALDYSHMTMRRVGAGGRRKWLGVPMDALTEDETPKGYDGAKDVEDRRTVLSLVSKLTPALGVAVDKYLKSGMTSKGYYRAVDAMRKAA